MRTVLALVAVLCQIFYNTPLYAGGCRGVTQTYAVAAPVYAVQKAVYTPTYNVYGITAVEQPYSVYVVGQDARDRQKAKSIDARLTSLEKSAETTNNSVNALLQLQYNQMQQHHGTGVNPPQGSLAQPTVSQTESAVIPVLQKHCAKCHTGEGSKGDFVMFGNDGQAVQMTAQHKFLIESVINDNSMPPGNEKVPNEGYQSIRKWYEEDPQTRAAIRAMAKGKKPKSSDVPVQPVPEEGAQR